jgi:hypothetical protein
LSQMAQQQAQANPTFQNTSIQSNQP